jgi:hypothetical protein
MYSKQIVWMIVFLCSLSLISAQEPQITLYKTEYAPGETLQAEVNLGNAETPLFTEQIALFSAPGQEVRVAPFLFSRGEDKYVVYFDLPITLVEGIYSFEAEEVPYIVNQLLKKITAQKTFAIKESANPVLAFSPGFFILKDEKELELRIENKKTTTDVIFNVTPGIKHVYNTPQVVQEGTKRTFRFVLDKKKLVDKNPMIEVLYGTTSYTIPLLLPVVKTIKQPQKKEVLELLTNADLVNHTIEFGETLSGPLRFKNKGNETLYNITLAVSGDLGLIVSTNRSVVAELLPNNLTAVHFWVNKEGTAAIRTYEGEITVQGGSSTLSLQMVIEVIAGSREPILPKENKTSTVDDDSEEPSFPSVFPGTKDPEPKPKKKEINYNVLIFIIAFVFAVIGFFIFRGRRTVEKKTFGEFMQGRNQRP